MSYILEFLVAFTSIRKAPTKGAFSHFINTLKFLITISNYKL